MSPLLLQGHGDPWDQIALFFDSPFFHSILRGSDRVYTDQSLSTIMTLLATVLLLGICILMMPILSPADAFSSSSKKPSRVQRFLVDPLSRPYRRWSRKRKQPETEEGRSVKLKRASDSRRRSVSVVLDDLMSSFLLDDEDDLDLHASISSDGSLLEEENGTGLILTASPAPHVTHFCFLVHGHRGMSTDLRYMQVVMQRYAQQEKNQNLQGGSTANETSSADFPETDVNNETSTSFIHDMVVHSAVCNEGKTTDGVSSGGERLVAEIMDTIHEEMENRSLPSGYDSTDYKNITISFVGNSLGGLYARYAIAKLMARHCRPENGRDDVWILENAYRIRLNVFCTTATPHLGVSRHTFIPIPRSAEIGVAHAMGETGKDLFRCNDLLQTMATCPTYLQPLAIFRQRIAYANAYGTDFPVPAKTAAFLSDRSDYPHHFHEEKTTAVLTSESGNSTLQELIIATVTTPPHDLASFSKDEDRLVEHDSSGSDDETDELHRMSQSLDRLSWKKVFVDMRKEIPSVELPASAARVVRRQLGDEDQPDQVTANLEHLKEQKDVVPSKDLARAVSLPASDNRMYFPAGHNMMVAFSRSRLSSFLHKGGRPLVDALAQELVRDIFRDDGYHERQV